MKDEQKNAAMVILFGIAVIGGLINSTACNPEEPILECEEDKIEEHIERCIKLNHNNHFTDTFMTRSPEWKVPGAIRECCEDSGKSRYCNPK